MNWLRVHCFAFCFFLALWARENAEKKIGRKKSNTKLHWTFGTVDWLWFTIESSILALFLTCFYNFYTWHKNQITKNEKKNQNSFHCQYNGQNSPIIKRKTNWIVYHRFITRVVWNKQYFISSTNIIIPLLAHIENTAITKERE